MRQVGSRSPEARLGFRSAGFGERARSASAHNALRLALALALLFSLACEPKADVNGDGVVNVLDASIVASCIGADPATDLPCERADVNGDGVIDLVDLQLVSDNFDENVPPIDSTPPGVSIEAPENLAFFGTSPIVVSGETSADTAQVTVNGVLASLANGKWTANVSLSEGNNALTAVAEDRAGNVGTASIQVTLDTTAPRVTISTPPDGFLTTDPAVTVSGMINDIVVGTVNGDQAEVTVNGLPAQVANRGFLAADVPLLDGPNAITATGTDRAGNTATTTITVIRQSVMGMPSIRQVSGNNQSGSVGEPLGEPLVVALQDANGAPVPGETVVFKVVQNNGLVSGGASTASSVAVTSDAQGEAQVSWRLGTRAGAGNNRVEARAVGFQGPATFNATAQSGPPSTLNLDSGNNQVGVAGEALPAPFVIVATDLGHNRLHGVPVTFEVTTGGGNFGGQPSVTVDTDSDGRALATLTLGPGEGFDNNTVRVDFAGSQSGPVVFTASARVAGEPSQTSVSGIVLDHVNRPIAGVTIHIQDTLLFTQTDAQGQFWLSPVPVGDVHLVADGTTAARPGTWPTLRYELVTIAGQDNTIGMPIFLLPLDIPNALFVDETSGGVLTLPELPGFSLSVAPGSATFPGGATSGLVSVTPVPADHVPMTPSFGQQPRFIVTIQPPGVLFDPPAPITFPNMDGLAPHEVTELYSFDHDLGQFVSIGTGTVSKDGSVVASDPGVGILKSGWHSGGNPPTFGTCEHDCDDANDCTDDKLVNGSCQHTPKADGADCKRGNECFKSATCMAGKCEYDPNLNVSGSDADKDTFNQLLRACGNRDKIEDLCDDNIDVDLGRNNGFIDGFNSKKIDLDDLEFVAKDNPCAYASDECQNLAHILGERKKALADGCASAADPCFTDAHHAGWAAESDYRSSTGHMGKVLSDSDCPGVDFCIRYDDDGDGMEDRRVEWDLDGGTIKSRKCVP